MKRLALIVLSFFGFQLLLTPLQPATAQDVPWTPGLYIGWVYFLERSDFNYALNENGVTVSDTTVLYQESHGELECNVSDADGNGTCGGGFPMEKIAGRFGTLTSQDCNATWRENVRAAGSGETPPISSLISQPLADGFSIGFSPISGPATANMVIDAVGSPTCQSQAVTAQVKIGIPSWPDLDFKIGYHTALTLGGTCNMKNFPRQGAIGRGTYSAAIQQCIWKMFYFDPYAKLP